LRTLSLADSGGLTLHKEPTDLSSMVDDLLTAWEPRALEANVRITAAVNVPGTLDLDPVRIRQVLDNLIANAVRHTPAGGDVEIDARLTATAVQVSVKDTGDGIPAEDLPHIFDRFWKSKDSGGSGLGLAIAKGVVTAHGGTISADSSVGTGTIIRISLPREILINGATAPRP
ncbi:MAG: sensor histidine kinase, partial [Chloroflexota bacterium]